MEDGNRHLKSVSAREALITMSAKVITYEIGKTGYDAYLHKKSHEHKFEHDIMNMLISLSSSIYFGAAVLCSFITA